MPPSSTLSQKHFDRISWKLFIYRISETILPVHILFTGKTMVFMPRYYHYHFKWKCHVQKPMGAIFNCHKHFSECLQEVDYNTSDRDLVPYCPSVFINCFVFSTWQPAFFSINFILNCIRPIWSYFQFGKLCSYTIYSRASYFLFSAVFLPAEDFQLGKCISEFDLSSVFLPAEDVFDLVAWAWSQGQ